MDIFDLDSSVIDRYRAFARSFTKIRSAELNEKVNDLYGTKRFWPEPLIQLNPHFATGGSIQDFVNAGDLEPECAEIFRAIADPGSDRDGTLKLHKHQEQAVGYAPCDAVPINRGTLVFHWCCPDGYNGNGENLDSQNYVYISVSYRHNSLRRVPIGILHQLFSGARASCGRQPNRAESGSVAFGFRTPGQADACMAVVGL